MRLSSRVSRQAHSLHRHRTEDRERTGMRVGQKGTCSDLPLKLASPSSRNTCSTRWATAIGSQMVARDEEAVPLNQYLPAVVTACVLQVFNLARQIPGIDVA